MVYCSLATPREVGESRNGESARVHPSALWRRECSEFARYRSLLRVCFSAKEAVSAAPNVALAAKSCASLLIVLLASVSLAADPVRAGQHELVLLHFGPPRVQIVQSQVAH